MANKNKTALVTGGAGFIGSHLVDRLIADGYQVRVLDDLSTGKMENLSGNDALEFHQGDLSDADKVSSIMQGVSLVFHQAAIASVPKTISDPLGSYKVNYGGTLNILEAARQEGVKRVVFASSAAVYGDLPGLPKKEDMPLAPQSPYAVDKLASEYACKMYTALHGLETVCLRYFNVFGPRQDPGSPYSGVLSIFSDRLSADKEITIYGDGEQTRDFIYISDVIDANIKAALLDQAVGKVFNVASGKAISIKSMLALMCEKVQKSCQTKHAEKREGDIRHSCADISLISKSLGWAPQVDMASGLISLLK